MNFGAVSAIYRAEMARFFRTLLQSFISPVISTSLYFVVFGSAIGGRIQEVEGIDPWTIYRALSEPLEGLGGRSPVDAVTHGTIDDVAEAVFNVLGVQVH